MSRRNLPIDGFAADNSDPSKINRKTKAVFISMISLGPNVAQILRHSDIKRKPMYNYYNITARIAGKTIDSLSYLTKPDKPVFTSTLVSPQIRYNSSLWPLTRWLPVRLRSLYRLYKSVGWSICFLFCVVIYLVSNQWDGQSSDGELCQVYGIGHVDEMFSS